MSINSYSQAAARRVDEQVARNNARLNARYSDASPVARQALQSRERYLRARVVITFFQVRRLFCSPGRRARKRPARPGRGR